MSETKWTPGPWLRDGRTVYALTPCADPRWAYKCPDGVNRFSCQTQGGGYPESAHDEELQANAHLIAAAPELYDALEEVLAIQRPKTQRLG